MKSWLGGLVVIVGAALAGCGSSAPAQGGERQACYGNHTCNAGLTCASNLCVVVPGSDGGAAGSGARDADVEHAPDAGPTDAASDADASTDVSSSDGDASTAAPFVVTVVDASPTVELRATTSVQVRVDPHGNQGSAALSVADLPAGITGVFTPSSVALDGVNAAMARLDLTTLSTTAAGAVPFRVIATMGATTQQATSSLAVQFAITFTIPAGARNRTGMDRTTFGAYPTIVTAPASFPTPPLMVRFYNADPTMAVNIQAHDVDFPQGSPDDIKPLSLDPLVRMPAMKNHPYDFGLHQNETCCAGELLIQ